MSFPRVAAHSVGKEGGNGSIVESNRNETLGRIATETLAALSAVAAAAGEQIGKRSAGVHSFAAINEFNAANAVANLDRIHQDVAAGYRQLRDEPAIARLIVADEDDRQQTLYISRNTSVTCDIELCSSLSPKGRLAALPVGGGTTIAAPGGARWYEVVERSVFKPMLAKGEWDARNVIVQSELFGPLTVHSLRDLLTQAGWSEDDLDLLARQLAQDDAEDNVREGMRRSVLIAMELRDQPILDQFQDEIFRLPIDRQLAILGPAGTGKTTTLVRRLRQKIDTERLTDDEGELIARAAENGQRHPQSWLMFTPTDLLRHYVKEAFAREGVPAPDSRIRTWNEHRRDLARRSLPILKSSSGVRWC